MTDLEARQEGTIRALREQIAQHVCEACKAKDQTITLLADVVDWHRSQVGPTNQSVSATVRPPADGPIFTADPRDLWATDEEEDIMAALAAGAMTSEEGERALAHLQAQNTQIQLVK